MVPVLDGAEGFRLEVRRPRALLVSLDVSGRAVSGTLRMTGRGAESRLLDLARGPLQLRFRAAGASTVTADLRPHEDGTLAFAAQLPDPDDRAWGDVPPERRLWTVDLVQGRRSERLAWPADGPREWWPVASDAALTAHRTERGNVQLRETSHLAVVEDVVLGDEVVVVVGRWLRPLGPAPWQPQTGAGRAGDGHIVARRPGSSPTGHGSGARSPCWSTRGAAGSGRRRPGRGCSSSSPTTARWCAPASPRTSWPAPCCDTADRAARCSCDGATPASRCCTSRRHCPQRRSARTASGPCGSATSLRRPDRWGAPC